MDYYICRFRIDAIRLSIHLFPIIILCVVISLSRSNAQSIEFPLILDKSIENQPLFSDEMWVSELNYNSDTLRVAVLQLDSGYFVLFSDANNNGIYDNYIELDLPIGLGKKAWIVSLSFEDKLLVLSPSDETPVVIGWQAPPLRDMIWNTDSYFDMSEVSDKVVMLVFCYSNCEGCIIITTSLEKILDTFDGDSRVELFSVVTSEAVAEANYSSVTRGWRQLLSSTSWRDFRVTPTPTVIIIGGDGIIEYRRVGGHKDLFNELSETIYELLERI